MNEPHNPADALSGKANFDDIYTSPDPRAFFTRLMPLEYQIPRHAVRLFRALLRSHPSEGHRVVDVCCSYGINAALLRYDVTLDDMFVHYAIPEAAKSSTQDLIKRDRRFYRARLRPDAPACVGVDIAAPAIAYATETRLLDEGFSENLEKYPPSPGLSAAVSDATLITISGGIGYITPATLTRLLDAAPGTVWVAATVLRSVPYEQYADSLDRYGLVTEKIPGVTVKQRRFTDDDERDSTLRHLKDLGIDTSGKEDEGFYHAECFVSRPKADCAARPLERLLG
ncbi:MAG TPA: hypothetical protein VE172_09920 [Stackebrandtia sp.]|jgi:hypothetical protein|uniref:hypothetical protein n=1 Tax=Stackebrandtia sp. TaxID=2023065 RepID=UPI002D4F4FD5|nr:hypothetical protein [Stackebrandtia sp.]HZE39113.1 hypothetical protein [Stackebrandtia sp.]